MKDFYCAAPWRGLHINPRGDVKTCCAGNPNMLGNLNTHSIEQVLNNKHMIKIRESLSQGIPHSYCDNCVQAERFGAESERHWHNRENPGFDYATAGELYQYPTIVDVRWNITCNLSCNYCGPSCSSKWAALQNVPFKSGSRPYYEQVCDFIEKHQDNIREVALVGGEPLLLPENERLLDVIPVDSTITLITNMSVELEKNKIFKKLQQRSKVGWSMSFDNIGQQFEYVRYGASWELLQRNLAIVKDLIANQGHWAGIHAVYNLYNATRLCDLRQFAHDNGVTVLWQNLFQPEYLDPALHGNKIAVLAANEIEKFYSMGIHTPQEKIFFDTALKNYQSINPGLTNPIYETSKQFVEHIHQIEHVYHPDHNGLFAKLWPELHSAFTWK